MSAELTLLELQREFLRALREPVFGAAREKTELPPRAGGVSDSFHRMAEQHITGTDRLAPVERLELYHRQYWYRLLDSLTEDFPVLRQLLGVEAFGRLQEAYLEAEPSRSFTLRHLGSRLADYLQNHPEYGGAQPVLAAELARIEYTLCEIFEVADLPLADPAMLGTEPLALAAHLHLFALKSPADEVWRRAGEATVPAEWPAAAEAPQFWVAVYRDRQGRQVRRLAAGEFTLLQAIAAHGDLAQALDKLDPATVDATDISRWFQEWMERGWLCQRPATPHPTRITVTAIPAVSQPVRIITPSPI